MPGPFFFFSFFIIDELNIFYIIKHENVMKFYLHNSKKTKKAQEYNTNIKNHIKNVYRK